MDMTCWTDDHISSMVSYYFIGFSFCTTLVWLPDLIGRIKTYKYFVIPTQIILFNASLYTSSYSVKCVLYFFMGLTKMKSNLTTITTIEHLPKEL